jgi:hypothetical protein
VSGQEGSKKKKAKNKNKKKEKKNPIEEMVMEARDSSLVELVVAD